MPSFDVVSEVDLHELRNAVDQANKEVSTRYDFKGTDCSFELNDDYSIIEAKTPESNIGKSILDVGAGSGCHSIILKEKELDVKAIDVSKGAVEVMLKRGVNAQCTNFDAVDEQYDTLLFLMNGLGLAGKLDGLSTFLTKAKSLLKPNGQIVLDSSDIKYMFEEEDGSFWIDLNST